MLQHLLTAGGEERWNSFEGKSAREAKRGKGGKSGIVLRAKKVQKRPKLGQTTHTNGTMVEKSAWCELGSEEWQIYV